MPLDIHCPKPSRPFKRKLDAGDLDPASRKRRLLSQVDSWLLETVSPPLADIGGGAPGDIDELIHPRPSPRAKSAPPRLVDIGGMVPVDYDKLVYSQQNLDTAQQMSHQQSNQPGSSRPDSAASTKTDKYGTSSSIYPTILYEHNVRVDRTGRGMPQTIRELVDGTILKPRSSESPPLSQEVLTNTIPDMDKIVDDPEGATYRILSSPMFPLNRYPVGQGGNTMWKQTDAIPNNGIYPHPISQPKPDVHVGYPLNDECHWTSVQKAAADHSSVIPYSQPARGNRYPWITFELKSEATGGTMWHALNQAAGSGSYCVNTLIKLLGKHFPTENLPITHTIAFTFGITPLQIKAQIHYISEERRTFQVSHIKTFNPLEPKDIQACADLVKNILEYGLGERQERIQTALGQLYGELSFSKRAASASTAPTTPATSSSGSQQPGKRLRR